LRKVCGIAVDKFYCVHVCVYGRKLWFGMKRNVDSPLFSSIEIIQ
jgi:hypothetical protein